MAAARARSRPRQDRGDDRRNRPRRRDRGRRADRRRRGAGTNCGKYWVIAFRIWLRSWVIIEAGMVRRRLRSFVNNLAPSKMGSPMLPRVAVVLACVLGAASAVSAVAEELAPEQARAFIVGKLFAYTCFDGTAGVGRIFADGSVVGTIRPGGRGETRFATLPPGTIRVEGRSMCAHLSGLPMQPCFRVDKIDYRSFRGSISGLG